MSYKTFHVPRSKAELINYLATHLNHVKKVSLKKMPVKQLYAIYYRMRSEG